MLVAACGVADNRFGKLIHNELSWLNQGRYFTTLIFLFICGAFLCFWLCKFAAQLNYDFCYYTGRYCFIRLISESRALAVDPFLSVLCSW